jgi:hypothetical protein
MSQGADQALTFLQTGSGKEPIDQPFVAVARSRDELSRWLHCPTPTLQWIQVEGVLGDSEVWSLAAQGADEIPLDVILSAPGSEFADLYRLVDVRAVRDVRVSMPAAPGFLKALRLAASLGLPARLLPGQPSTETLAELQEALEFYLRDPMVDAPIEFFHSALAWFRGAPTGSLWRILEEDPAIYQRSEAVEEPCASEEPWAAEAARDFVPLFLEKLRQRGAECTTCPWQTLCEGYFKWPDLQYSCEGVKRLLFRLQAAAEEIEEDLSAYEPQPA